MASVSKDKKMCLRLFLAILLFVTTSSAMGPPERSYKILMLLPISSKSHRNVFMPLVYALADRGHKIVMLQNQPPNTNHPNIYDLTFEKHSDWMEKINVFVDDPMWVSLRKIHTFARDLYLDKKIMALYERRKEFDIAILDHMMAEIALPFTYGLTSMSISTAGLNPRQSVSSFGNLLNPAYVPSLMVHFPSNPGFLDRIINLFGYYGLPIVYYTYFLPKIQKEIDRYFPELPPLSVLEKNESMVLLNQHFSLSPAPAPLLPSQIEVGGMHCRPGNPLPQELLSWVEGAGSAGVVYFSLGSISKSNTMPENVINDFKNAFSQLKQRVIWKFEGELPGISDNVLIKNWLPQQDILAHQNVRLFISHGGLLGLQEAMYHATPAIILPIFGDQSKNAKTFKEKGLTLALDWNTLTEDVILKAINEILNNPIYTASAAEVSKIIKDQPDTSVERAVFWTEYVIRHKGARHMRSPAADLSWTEILMLDAIAAFIIILFLCLSMVYYIVRTCFRRVLSHRKRKKE